MSAVVTIIISGIAFTAMFGGLIIAWWHGYRNLCSVLLVACVATLAVAASNAGVG